MKILLFLMLTLVGCTVNDFYDFDAISAVTRKGNTLNFNVRTESLYFAPGFLRERKSDGDHLKLVRCKVGKECRVDISLTQPPRGDAHQVNLPSDISDVIHLVGKSRILTVQK